MSLIDNKRHKVSKQAVTLKCRITCVSILLPFPDAAQLILRRCKHNYCENILWNQNYRKNYTEINRIETVPGDRGKGEGRWEIVVVRKDKKGKCGEEEEEGNCVMRNGCL